VIAAWADRYLPSALNREPDTSGGGPASVVVTDSGDGALTQKIQAGGHALIADEPASVGGDDLGPTPYDLLLAALGACTSMTVRMYARRKNWPLRSTTVTLTHSKIHAADCEACETTSGRLDHILREVSFDGDLDADQRARLLEIADKCPVHRTLHSEVVVETTAAQLALAHA
jgi:putative redox protein